LGEYFSSVSEFHVVGNEEMNVGNEMGNEYSPYAIEKQDPRAKNISKTM
jgi:hypothetical protein